MFKELFEVQRKLDAEIESKKPTLPGENRYELRRLALIVELGELANEIRFFKFWSTDREQRPATLEEYVDCLHFFISIGLENGKSDVKLCKFEKEPQLTETFREIFNHVSAPSLRSEVCYTYAFSRFIQIGELIGFSKDEIYEAYMAKNLINHQRQESGY